MARTPHLRYVRHRRFDKLRYGTIEKEFIHAQATRLGLTDSVLFNTLMKSMGLTADEIVALASSPIAGAPHNTVAPVLSGTATVGQTLTVTNGTWTGTPTPTYTRIWKRGSAVIAGATGTTYVLATADIGASITCVVKGANTGGSTSKPSNAIGPVIAS